jgi:DNA-binding HxlR family transcriptional regulator
MRSYHQYCGLAKALDVIGDRWTLLIVRELLLRERCRYTDLRNGLPGIATNLLADRLRELEEGGIVSREEAPPPVATTVFKLTERGRELEPIVHQIGRWGGPLVRKRSRGDTFCSHWIALPAKLHLTDHAPERPPIAIELRCGDAPMVIETVDGDVRMHEGSATHPDVVLTGTPEVIVGVLTGKVTIAEAQRVGLRHEGNLNALRRVLPRID